jgi:protein TonB
MARRRKNPLLGRILLVSAAVHVVALPVLAYFGAFKKIQASMVHSVVEVVPAPAPPEKEPPPEEKKPEKEPEEKKAPAGEEKSQSNLNQPKVAAASGAPGSGDAAGPTVNPQGTGQAGQVPTPTAKTDGGTGGTQPPVTKVETPSVAVAAPKANPSSEPVTEKPVAKSELVKPHVPVLASAEPLAQPLPEVPDDLRAEALDKSVVVTVVVSPEGKANELTVTSSSGTAELDDLAVKAVKRWTFRPATRDGEPVAGKVRVHVRFKVEG